MVKDSNTEVQVFKWLCTWMRCMAQTRGGSVPIPVLGLRHMWKLLFTICKRSCSPQLCCMGTSSETSKSGRRDISSTAVSKPSYQCQASVTSFALSNQKTFTLTKARRRSLETLGLLPISPSPSAPVHEIKDTCMNALGLSGVRRLFFL